MNILRPPGGFKIVLTPGVQALVDEAKAELDGFDRYWIDITERLRFTAHLEGVADRRFGPGNRLWVSAEDVERGLPRVKLVYLVLGAKVTINVAAIG